jgi:tyrosine-protein phosphatase YwqE
MDKADEISQNMRSDPKMIYGITAEFYAKIINEMKTRVNQALVDFNSELIEFTRNQCSHY